MRRVYVMWFLRRATRPAMVRLYIVSLAFIEVVHAVSLPNVFANMSEHDAPRLVPFMQSAFSGTEFAVQVAVL